MKKINVEMSVGFFLLIGFACFAYLAVKMGDLDWFSDETYQLEARFNSISGLKEGATIELAGVKIGKVAKIALDGGEYEAVVDLKINRNVQIQEDSIASIRTAGIIGDRYVNIKPGGSEDYLANGDAIEETESAISLEELVSKYIFDSK